MAIPHLVPGLGQLLQHVIIFRTEPTHCLEIAMILPLDNTHPLANESAEFKDR